MTSAVKVYLQDGYLKAEQKGKQFSTPLDGPVLLTLKMVNAEGDYVDVTTSISAREVVTMLLMVKVVNVA